MNYKQWEKKTKACKTQSEIDALTEQINDWCDSLVERYEAAEEAMSIKLSSLGGDEADQFYTKINRVLDRLDKKQDMAIAKVWNCLEKRETKISG